MPSNYILHSNFYKRNSDVFEQLKRKHIELECGNYDDSTELKYLDNIPPKNDSEKKKLQLTPKMTMITILGLK